MSDRQRASGGAGFLAVLILVLGIAAQVIKQPIQAEGLFRVRVLDIGQGDAILLDTPHGDHILVDAGPSAETFGVLNRYLAQPRRFRLVIASHSHVDHIGGFPAVLGEYPADEAWLSGSVATTEAYTKWLSALKRGGTQVKTVSYGDGATIDEVELRVLHPLEPVVGQRLSEEHDGTVVVRASYGAVSVLLTGDLAADHEADILAKDPAAVGSTVLKVTHHGSKYGSSDAFLAAVHPAVAAISAGKDNKFGHPHQETLDRLAAHHIPVYRTDTDGTVEFVSDGARLWVQPEHGARQEVDIVGAAR